MPARRFPPPWSVEEQDACFVVRDHSGQKLAYVYFEDELRRRSAGCSPRMRRGGSRDFATLNSHHRRGDEEDTRQSRWSRLIPLAGALALMTTYASAQGSPTRLRGGQHILTPEEKQIDNDYKAATSKIPDQKPNDPWGAIRPAPSTPSPKTPTGAGAKKTQQ
jgi:hypothetical protein